MTGTSEAAARGWRESLPAGLRPYTEKAPLAAFFLGVSSGAPYALIAATLTTRLAQDGIEKRAITAFALAFLVYNLKWLWAWVIDGVRLPLLGRLGQRVSWLLLAGVGAMLAIANLAIVDPKTSLAATAYAAILVAFAGATYDIVIDAYRIEALEPRQLGVGAGMSQYGWRIGSVSAGALALVVASSAGWQAAYLACALFALPAMAIGLLLGEPARHRAPVRREGLAAAWEAVAGPLAEFFRRSGAWLVLLFVLLHKIGDTLANLTFRLLFDSQGYTNAEIALYDVGFGFWAYLAGIFVGGVLFFLALLGMKVVPTYLEYFTIQRHLKELARESEGSTPGDLKGTFDKRATIDDITSVNGEDLEFVKSGEGYDITLTYAKKVELFGPVSLCFDFEMHAGK